LHVQLVSVFAEYPLTWFLPEEFFFWALAIMIYESRILMQNKIKKGKDV
jgi:hypothetical protein